jgi:hypothetical protein
MVAVVSVDEDLIVVRLVRDFLGHASILALPGRPDLPDCAARIGMICTRGDSPTRSHAVSAGKLIAVATATSAPACGCIEAWPSLLA